MKYLNEIGGRVLLLASALLAGAVQAAPGLDHRLRAPHYASEALRLVVQDLEVQALGEAPIRIERTWKNGQWVWNERWEDLEVYGAADPDAPEGVDDPINASRPYGIRHLRQNYLHIGSRYSTLTGIGSTFGTGGAERSLDPDRDIVLSSLPYRTIVALKRGLDGYRWLDIYGNRNEYDPQGRMTHYVFYNGIRVSLVRDAEQRIVAVKDHGGKTRVSMAYDTAGNLISLKDYSGREVRYEYTDQLLTAVTDVLGQRWEYHYSGTTLAGYTDPLRQRTTLVLSGDKVRSQRHPDGRWSEYSYGYEQDTERFYVRERNESGLIKEQWYDRLGHEVRRQLNGDLQFTREFILSDNSTYVRKVAERFKAISVSSGGGGGGGTLYGISRSTEDPPEPPYVIKRIEQDARGNRTITEYNRHQQVIRVLYPDDSEIRRTYDPTTNRVAEEIDERGNKTQYRYDSRGNLIQTIQAAGTAEQYVISYGYDSLSRLITEVHAGSGDTPQARWAYRYDEHGNCIAVVDPLGHETAYTRDVLGHVLSLTNALGKTWSASYDATGNLLTLTTPLGQVFTYQYDSLGQLTRFVAPNEGELALEYSAGGMPTSITDAANATTRFEYDAGRRLTAVIDPLGNRLQRQYDARGRLARHQDAAGNATQYLYDNDRLSGIDFPTYGERYAYDNRDRPVEASRAFQVEGVAKTQASQSRYLRNGLLSQWIDAANNPMGSEYDAQNRLVASLDAEGGTTRFAYDVRGNLVQVTDPAGRITRFQYDARDAVVAEIKPGDSSTPRTERRYQYDAVGNLTRTVSPDGRVSLYSYDAGNRLTQERHFISETQASSGTPERTTSYSYTALNALRGYEDEDSKAVYSHDLLGRVTAVTVTYKTASPVFSKTFSYTYDAKGQKASYTNPEQQTYDYRYTSDSQLAGVSIPGEGSLSQQSFNWLQPQQILFPGGSALQIVHDGLLRYTSRTLRDPAGNPILSRTYQYDAVDNITAIDNSEGQTQYGYDKLYRLTQADYPESDSRTDEAYAYDGVGNRLDEATSPEALDISQWQYNAHNQLVSHDGIGYRYNADGHLIEKGALQADGRLIQAEGIDHWQYRYDSRERLVEVEKNGQLLAKYAYNPLGQRISKTLAATGATTYYLYSEEGLVAEYDEQGSLKQEYAYDPTAYWMSRPLFTRAKRKDTGAWSVSYFGNSHLGTPEVAFERSGEVTWRAQGQAFGETVVSLNTIDNPLRFPGQYLDGESGLYQNYFRDYDPQIGRYVESDPIGLDGGLNTFGYALQRPVGLIDPSGLTSVLACALNPATAVECAAAGIASKRKAVARIVSVSTGGDGEGECECEETKSRDQALYEALEYVGEEFFAEYQEVGWDQYNFPGGARAAKGTPGWAAFRRQHSNAPYGYRTPNGAEIVEHPLPDPELPQDQNHMCPHFHAKRNLADPGIRITYKPGT